MIDALNSLKDRLEGELFWDELHKNLYATDASVYRKIPHSVAHPKSEQDLVQLVKFSKEHNIPIIPRAGGTSLAGQCVGYGLVVDVSKYLTHILSFDKQKGTVRVQPGVIRDDLNRYLEPHGFFFGPNTSTSNRCTLGGMVGNNSSGTTSIRYGVTRDKILSVKVVLSDGSVATFDEVNNTTLQEKQHTAGIEGSVYRTIGTQLSDPDVQQEIEKHFPKSEIHRRNTGYAVDALLETAAFSKSEEPLNLSKLICGSEGTLAMISEITLKLDKLPPGNSALVVAHYAGIQDCLNDVLVAMKHPLYTCEMMDDIILNCTRNNKKYDSYRYFIKGEPRALLMLELRADTTSELDLKQRLLIEDLQKSGRSYHQTRLTGDAINKALELRKAGLGLLGNMVGDEKAVACIEDTAVALADLPGYIDDFHRIMEANGQRAVYYAHAGAGELHLRPILNLKKKEGVRQFREITTQVAELVKKYRGSLSGEHGDGIVRGEFLPVMIGDKNYSLLKTIKDAFDPDRIFNPGKIIESWKMDDSLRYEMEREEPEIPTAMDFSDHQGILRLVESCNGSGDCRKPAESGGTMCPSYQATRNEKDSTRGRANVLREILTNNSKPNRFDSPEIKKVLDLCISCKACASECPSNVDIASVKSEFQHQYRKANGTTLQDRIFADSSRFNKLASKAPGLINFLYTATVSAKLIRRIGGIAPKRSLPKLAKRSFSKRYPTIKISEANNAKSKVYLFVDEFSNYLDADVAEDTYELLIRLGFDVQPITHLDSGRALFSKGFLEKARVEVDRCVADLKELVSSKSPLVGIEPSAILGFRDEFVRMASDKQGAESLAQNSFLIEEFLAAQADLGEIGPEHFTAESRSVKIHMHCHQKALGDMGATFKMLNLPLNYHPTIIPSGCCGMAGSFGFEARHYELSMKIGELRLFPAVRKVSPQTIIAANGTSCRHQILDGTGQKAQHPATVLKNALK